LLSWLPSFSRFDNRLIFSSKSWMRLWWIKRVFNVRCENNTAGISFNMLCDKSNFSRCAKFPKSVLMEVSLLLFSHNTVWIASH
jgi:hypothetical protein